MLSPVISFVSDGIKTGSVSGASIIIHLIKGDSEPKGYLRYEKIRYTYDIIFMGFSFNDNISGCHSYHMHNQHH